MSREAQLDRLDNQNPWVGNEDKGQWGLTVAFRKGDSEREDRDRDGGGARLIEGLFVILSLRTGQRLVPS